MKKITILDVLSEEGYQKFLDAGVGAKLSGTTFRADDPANNLFWAMFRRASEQREEMDVVARALSDTKENLERAHVWLNKYAAQLDKNELRIGQLEKVVVNMAIEMDELKAVMEARDDEL